MIVHFIIRAWLAFGIPPDVAALAYRAGHRHHVDPADIVAMLVAEDSHHDSVGRYGERGVLQLAPMWRRAYNRRFGTAITKGLMHEPAVNLEVGAWVIRRMQRKHRRCGAGHSWTAHYQCASKARGTSRCNTKWRDSLVKRARRVL